MRVRWIRETVWKRSASSWGVRSERRGRTRCGETRMWPGRRGLRFTRAKVEGVVWKTYRVGLSSGVLGLVEVVIMVGILPGRLR